MPAVQEKCCFGEQEHCLLACLCVRCCFWVTLWFLLTWSPFLRHTFYLRWHEIWNLWLLQVCQSLCSSRFLCSVSSVLPAWNVFNNSSFWVMLWKEIIVLSVIEVSFPLLLCALYNHWFCLGHPSPTSICVSKLELCGRGSLKTGKCSSGGTKAFAHCCYGSESTTYNLAGASQWMEHPSLSSVLLVSLLLLMGPTPSPECCNPVWSGSHLPSAHVAVRRKSCSTAWSSGWFWGDALLKSLLLSMQHQLPCSDSPRSWSRNQWSGVVR